MRKLSVSACEFTEESPCFRARTGVDGTEIYKDMAF